MNAKDNTIQNKYQNMNPYEFERSVASYFTTMGYQCEVRGGSYDKGVDLIAEKNKEKIAIQIKMYDQRMVNYKAIMYLFAAQHLFNCQSSILITTGAVREDAKKIASELNVELIEYWNFSKGDNKIESDNFFYFWKNKIEPLNGKTISTVTGKENVILNVSYDGIKRKTSNGKTNFIAFDTLKEIYKTIKKSGEITRIEINHLYPGRISSFVIALFLATQNFLLLKNPIRIKDKNLLK